MLAANLVIVTLPWAGPGQVLAANLFTVTLPWASLGQTLVFRPPSVDIYIGCIKDFERLLPQLAASEFSGATALKRNIVSGNLVIHKLRVGSISEEQATADLKGFAHSAHSIINEFMLSFKAQRNSAAEHLSNSKQVCVRFAFGGATFDN